MLRITLTQAYEAALAEIASVDAGLSTVTALTPNEPFSDFRVKTSNGWTWR